MENAPEQDPSTRQSLLGRLKDWNDDASWQDFFNTYWRRIYGAAIKAGLNENEAQEVVQETIIAVSKQMPGFKYDPAIGTFKSWLLNQTQWKIADHLRRRERENNRARPARPARPARRRSSDTTTDRTGTVEKIADPNGGTFETVWNQEWEKRQVEAALDQLKRTVNPKHYQIFDFYVLKKWPMKKVTQTLNVNMAQVYLAKSRLSRLLKAELKRLEDNTK